MKTSMQGKICLITGGSSGIGKATALGLAKLGATVVILVRDQAQGQVAVDEIKQLTQNQNIELIVCDLASQDSVHQAAATFKQRFSHLHVLINNAGVFLPNRTETPDGIETTFAVNYLSHFLLTHLLIGTLKASAPARIINVASKHQGIKINFEDLMLKHSYSVIRAVGPTKLALILFAKTLSKQLKGSGVSINCLHPGVARTNLLNNINPIMRILVHLFSATPEKAARTSIYLASAPEVAETTGQFFCNCRVVPTVGQANDEGAERRLWQESLKLTKISDYMKDN